MANVSLWGGSYSSVPYLTVPKTGGGTAQFDDTTDADATTSDIISGKTAYVNGTKLTGNVVLQNYYTGSTAPSSSLGSNGDLYLQS